MKVRTVKPYPLDTWLPRSRRLATQDRLLERIDRCPDCGTWSWRAWCTTCAPRPTTTTTEKASA